MSDTRDDVPRYDGLTDPIVAAVQSDMAWRSVLGIKKYGTTLDTLEEIEALQHAYEEAMDMALYLRAAIERRRGK